MRHFLPEFPGSTGRMPARSGFIILVLALFFGAANVYGQGTWAPVATLAPHSSGGVMLLLTDGTIMVKTGSGGGNGNIWDKLTPDVHGSYINGTWSTLAPMADDRLYFSSQVLRDGRVYVCGGEYGAGGSKGEVYDPITNTWTATPLTGYVVSDANSELLPDGRVLQACVGSGTRHTKIWDPVSNTYSTGPDCLRTDNEAAWLKLPDNSILFIDNYGTTSERYIPATNTWINDAAVPTDIYDPYGDEAGGAFLLPDGRGFFVGSSGHNAIYTPSGTTAPGTWTAAADIPGPSGTPDAAAAMMVNGNILIAASDLPTSADHFPSPTSFFEYDYTTNTFTATGAPGGGTTVPVSSYYTNMLAMPDGTILYVQQGSNRFYEYTPGSAALPAGKPTLNTITRLRCDTFMATGTLFNGISEGASYGDDWQMETNYPLIRLKSGSNVYYTRTTYWNSTGVARGGQPDTTLFALPAGLPPGVYTAEVVVNGNASAGFPINTSMAISPAASSFCQGTTNTLTDVWPGGTWSSANPAIASVDPVTGVVTGVAGGSTTISYFLGTCFATATVTINPAPSAITPSGAVNICFGSSSTFSSFPTGGTWTSTAPFIAGVGSLSGIVSGLSAGVATISYTAVGCSVAKQVTVNMLPVATITATGPLAICPSGTVVLDAPTGSGNTYQWILGGSPVAGATGSSYTASVAGSYKVTVTSSAGCSATSAVTVVTSASVPPAVITPSGPTTFCAGGSVTLNASSGSGLSYQWQSGGVDIPGATAASYVSASSGGYDVVVTNLSGCSSTSGSALITVNTLPAPITGVLSVCSGSTTSLFDALPGGTWTSSNLAVATAGSSSGIITGVGSTGGLATITYTLSTGCSITAVVTVNAATAAAITGPGAVCTGQTIALADGTPGGTWSSSLPSVATVSATGVVTGVGVGSATISYAVATACGTATATRSITSSNPPVVAPITGTLTICSGSTSLLADVTPSGVWSSTNPSIATVAGAGLVTAVAPGLDTILYSVTNIAGCTASAIAVFDVFSSVASSVTAAGPTSFCTGGSVLLNAITGTGVTYQWKKNTINITGATASSYTANSSGDYTVLITLPGGCNGTTLPLTVSVNPAPIVIPAVSITATAGPVFCTATAPATFTAIPSNGGITPSYQWYVNGSGAGTGSSFGYTPAAGDVVECRMTSSATCAFPLMTVARDTISVSPLRTPSVSITESPAILCSGSPATFVAVPVYGGSAPTYRWTRNDTSVATGYAYVYTPHYGDVIKVTLVSNFPCLAVDSAVSPSLTLHPQAPVPNTLSVSVTQSGIVAGSVDTFVAIAPFGGGSPQFQWLLNSNPIPGATNSIYVTSTLAAGDVISCRETSSMPCAVPATVTSGGITVRIIPVGVDPFMGKGAGLSLVPNPSPGTFTIRGALAVAADGYATITVADMLGQQVYTSDAAIMGGLLNHTVTLDGSLASGLYIVNITYGDSHMVYRVVVSR